MSDVLDIRDTYIALANTAVDRVCGRGCITATLAVKIRDCDAFGAFAVNLAKATGPDITAMTAHLQQLISDLLREWDDGDFRDWLAQADAPAAFLASRV